MSLPPVVALGARTAIGYVRVSTEDQMDGYSIAHQRGSIEESCRSQGIPLVGMIGGDQGESGKDLNRPGITALESALRSDSSIGYVVCTRLDRLTRSFDDCAQLLDVFKTHQISLVAVEEGSWAEATSDNLMRYIRALIAATERQAILHRSAAGQKEAAGAGQHIGGRRPFGYAWRPLHLNPVPGQSSRAKILVVIAAEAETVRALFATAVSTGWGSRRLADWARQHYPQHATLSAGRVRAILANPVYVGDYHAHLRDGAQSVIIANHHQAIVERDVFARVQLLQASRTQDHEAGHGDTAATSLLGGIALCGRCGESLVMRREGSPTQKNPSSAPPAHEYICHSACDGVGCGLEPADATAVESFLARLIENQLVSQQVRLQRLADSITELVPQYLDREAGIITTSLAALARERLAWEQRMEEGVIDIAGWQRHDEHLAAEETKLHGLALGLKAHHGLIHLLQAQADASVQPLGTMRWITFAEGLAALSHANRRRFVRQVADRLVWHGPQSGDFNRFWQIEGWHVDTALASLTEGMARAMAQTGGWDVAGSMKRRGWTQESDDDQLRWQHPNIPDVTLAVTSQGVVIEGGHTAPLKKE